MRKLRAADGQGDPLLVVAGCVGVEGAGGGLGAPVLVGAPRLEEHRLRTAARGDGELGQALAQHGVALVDRLAGRGHQLRGGQGHARASELLDSGAALAAMERLIAAQGRQTAEARIGELSHDVRAPYDGRVAAIDCHLIARIARLAGAPMEKGAGIDLLCKVGDAVGQGETLYRIHATSQTGLGFACELAGESSGFEVVA